MEEGVPVEVILVGLLLRLRRCLRFSSRFFRRLLKLLRRVFGLGLLVLRRLFILRVHRRLRRRLRRRFRLKGLRLHRGLCRRLRLEGRIGCHGRLRGLLDAPLTACSLVPFRSFRRPGCRCGSGRLLPSRRGEILSRNLRCGLDCDRSNGSGGSNDL